MVPAVVAGEELWLLPEKAAYWPRQHTLFVADVHLGKAAAFRAAALPIPKGTNLRTLANLSCAVRKTDAKHIVFLGDLWHAKAGRTEAGLQAFSVWRAEHSPLVVTLVIGNHDIKSGPLPPDLGVEEIPEGEVLGPFGLRHHPEEGDGYSLCGHLHPGAELVGPGRQAVRLPCFWFGARIGILPAFGEFTGLATIRPKRDDKVFVVADGRVLPV